MKKNVILAASLSLAFMMTACGAPGSSGSSDATTNSASAATSAVGSTDTGSGEPVEITFLVSKPEAVSQYEEVFQKYHDLNPNVTISTIPLSGQSVVEKMTSLYASGNAPTVMMCGGTDLALFSDKVMDLKDTEIGKLAQEWATATTTTDDGKLIGVPVTAEGLGIMYNSDAIEAATGEPFDPTQVKTRSDLRTLMEKVQAAGGNAAQITNLDWMLGGQYTSVLHSTVATTQEGRMEYMYELEEGKVDLMSDPTFNNWMDTLDLFREFNVDKDSPLSNTYEDDQMRIANGDVAFWFTGSFVYPAVESVNPDPHIGLLPCYISDDPNEEGNSKIILTSSAYAIDTEQNSEAQQQAALDFLTWLVTDPTGQDCYVNVLKFVPAYDGFTVEPQDVISKALVQYMNDGNAMGRVNSYFPSGLYPKLGETMQKYLDNQIDRAELAKEFEAYWVEYAQKAAAN